MCVCVCVRARKFVVLEPIVAWHIMKKLNILCNDQNCVRVYERETVYVCVRVRVYVCVRLRECEIVKEREK